MSVRLCKGRGPVVFAGVSAMRRLAQIDCKPGGRMRSLCSARSAGNNVVDGVQGWRKRKARKKADLW